MKSTFSAMLPSCMSHLTLSSVPCKWSYVCHSDVNIFGIPLTFRCRVLWPFSILFCSVLYIMPLNSIVSCFIPDHITETPYLLWTNGIWCSSHLSHRFISASVSFALSHAPSYSFVLKLVTVVLIHINSIRNMTRDCNAFHKFSSPMFLWIKKERAVIFPDVLWGT